MLFWAISLWAMAHAAFMEFESFALTQGEKGLAVGRQAQAFFIYEREHKALSAVEEPEIALTAERPTPPADAPLLPSRLYYAADGWFDWGGWRYHQTGLVCPPDLGAYSRASGDSGSAVAAQCNYYGPELQPLALHARADGADALGLLEDAYHDRGFERVSEEIGETVLTRVLASDDARAFLAAWRNQEGQAFTLEAEFFSDESADLPQRALDQARRAQAALDKRDRLSTASR